MHSPGTIAMGKGRAPCCAKVGLKRGSWTLEEDMLLISYIQNHGSANWRALPKQAGLLRCGKSCRLRWINYLQPDLKRGNFTVQEEETIIKLQNMLGNKWSKIASCLPGRTDNEIKNIWNTHLKKRVAAATAIDVEQKKKKKKKSKKEITCSNVSPTMTMETTNFPRGGFGEQSNTNKEEVDLEKIEIPMLDLDFDINILLDGIPVPCSSACVVHDQMLDLPENNLLPGLQSITDSQGGADTCTETSQAPWKNAAPCHGNGTDASAATVDDGKERWLEELERELGLWDQHGPVAGTSSPELDSSALLTHTHADL